MLKHLLQDVRVLEIRALDKLPGENHNEMFYKNDNNKIQFYECDLVDLESCRNAFRGVDVVLHCAGYVDYEYPPDVNELQKNNVEGGICFIKI